MPTLSTHFPYTEAECVERAASAARQKMAQYIGQAVRERMEREGMLPGSVKAGLHAKLDELIDGEGEEVAAARLGIAAEQTCSLSPNTGATP